MSVVPSQVLYLEHGSSRLYAEAIQIVDTRQLCWARPTLLIQGLPKGPSLRQDRIAAAATAPERSELHLYDVEDGPDLIWPLDLFHIACDIDFFSLLVQLKMNPDDIDRHRGNKHLNDFIRSFWHTHTEAFQASGPAGEISS
jgi:hypothetical protein